MQKQKSTDTQTAKRFVMKPKMHKICLNVPRQVVVKMKKKAIDEGITMTQVFCQLAKEYVDG